MTKLFYSFVALLSAFIFFSCDPAIAPRNVVNTGTDNNTTEPTPAPTEPVQYTDKDWFVAEFAANSNYIEIASTTGLAAVEYKKASDSDWTNYEYSANNKGGFKINGLTKGETYQVRFKTLESITFYGTEDSAEESEEDNYSDEEGPFTYPLTKVLQWGTSHWKSMRNMFYNCEELVSIPENEVPNMSELTDMSGMFYGCSQFNQALPEGFDTSNVTDMSSMFSLCVVYDKALPSSFNTSNVTNMSAMFEGCSAYNQVLPSNFNTSKVTNMSLMFSGCEVYNQTLPSSFNTSNVTDMSSMFQDCIAYNQVLPEGFDTSNVTNMTSMFSGCEVYNQPFPSSFNTSNVTDMNFMFVSCYEFDQDISAWNVEKVENFLSIFEGASSLTEEHKPAKFRDK